MKTKTQKLKQDPRRWYVQADYQTADHPTGATDALIFKAARKGSSSAGFDPQTGVRDHEWEEMTRTEALKFQLRLLDLLDAGVVHAVALGRYRT